MPEKRFTASLSRSQGRTGWSVIFRHPVRRDEATGQRGLRIRRGLGTRDDKEAEQLKSELNALLSQSQYWDLAARAEAERRFDRRIVDIFYDKMLPEETDYNALRNAVIPFPESGKSEYRQILLLGTTGAGKTTIVRQLIGTDPTKERFPSTSTAKTTIHETEILLDEGPSYRAVVTFVSSDEVREHLNECISTAVLAAYRGAPDSEVLRHLLNHVNQRFRFSYVLGNGPVSGFADFGENDDDDDNSTEDEIGALWSEELEEIDLGITNTILESTIEELRQTAKRHGGHLRQELQANEESDQRVVDEIFEEELDNLLREDDVFHLISDRLMDEIEKRFDLLKVGELRRTKQGWPFLWQWQTQDRQAFIKAVTRLSSNHAPLFGRLLTPLVSGVRVAGPFSPLWTNGTQPKLIILDGEGLGHTPKMNAAMSTALSRRVEQADAVLLVDNALQPMLAAPVSVMRELVSSGNASKLLVAFTHFDSVKGDNLPTPSAKAQHVLASAENVLSAIGEELGPFAERALRKRLEKVRFFLGGIHERLNPETKSAKRTIDQLRSLLGAIDTITERPQQAPARPVYDRANLILAIKASAENFQNAWSPLLGIKTRPGMQKEHWTRIKALSRRLATPGWSDEYDTLKPVADLQKQLKDQIYLLIQNPISWEGDEPTDDEKQQTYEALASNVSRRMLELASRRVRVDRHSDWQNAYYQAGRGSTFTRAKIIADQVYDRAAPIPDVTPSPDRNQFLREVNFEVEAAAGEEGATFK
jgi:GTPase SAR1 family protein